MAYNDVSKAILRRMYYFGFIGTKHLTFEDIIINFPPNRAGSAKSRLEELIEENLILHHITDHGDEYSVNPQSLEEIDKILD